MSPSDLKVTYTVHGRNVDAFVRRHTTKLLDGPPTHIEPIGYLTAREAVSLFRHCAKIYANELPVVQLSAPFETRQRAEGFVQLANRTGASGCTVVATFRQVDKTTGKWVKLKSPPAGVVA